MTICTRQGRKLRQSENRPLSSFIQLMKMEWDIPFWPGQPPRAPALGAQLPGACQLHVRLSRPLAHVQSCHSLWAGPLGIAQAHLGVIWMLLFQFILSPRKPWLHPWSPGRTFAGHTFSSQLGRGVYRAFRWTGGSGNLLCSGVAGGEACLGHAPNPKDFWKEFSQGLPNQLPLAWHLCPAQVPVT